MAHLKITDAAGRVLTYELNADELLAGRASANAIQINDEKSSRQHFKVLRIDRQFYVEDLGSTNGTRVNGIRISERVLLRSGDTVSVGKCVFIFDDDSQPQEEPPEELPEELPESENTADTFIEQKAAASFAPAAKEKSGALDKDFDSADEHGKTGKPRFVLKMLEGVTPGKVYDLGAEAITLGRHASNTIAIDDDAASNYHAEVAREAIGYVVTDLGSTNGTRVKAKGKADFEKVVKTPLTPGMQIRVGKTLLEFQNIGGSAEEDQVFKTMELDTDKFHQRIAALQGATAAQLGAASGGARTGMGAAAKLGIFAGVAGLVALGVIFGLPLLKKTGGGSTAQTDVKPDSPKVPKAAANLVSNGDFEGGTDEDGYPVDFQVSKTADVHIKVAADASHDESKDPKRRGLQISKGGAKAQSRQTLVESRDPIAIDANKTYELAGWARNDEDGIYGLRVAWVHGDRELAENPVVLKDSQEWKELKSPALTPPAWATHARAGVFVQGKAGKASFDGLSFKEKSGSAPQRVAPIRFGGIDLQFEGTKGLFSVSSQGKSVAEDCTLRLESSEGKAGSDLASAMKPNLNKSGDTGGVSYEGRLYDFSLQDLAPYSIAAQPGAVGVDLKAGFELPADSASKPLLRFYLTGPAATGDIDVSKADKTGEHLTATDDKTVAAVKGVLFNAGKAPQFNLLFAKPVELNLKREGKRRLVEIRFDAELQVSMSPEDVEQKQKMLAAVADMRRALAAKEWGAAEDKAAQLKTQFGGSFPQANEEAGRATEALESAWKGTQEELAQMLAALQKAATPELLEKSKAAAQRATDAWKGSTEKSAAIGASVAQIDALAAQSNASDADKKADEALRQAEAYMDKKIYNVAISFLKAKILDDPVASKTKAAERARELLPKAEAAQKKMDDIASISERLKGLAKNYILGKKYGEAIRAIETDPEYRANRADLTEIQAMLDDLRKK